MKAEEISNKIKIQALVSGNQVEKTCNQEIQGLKVRRRVNSIQHMGSKMTFRGLDQVSQSDHDKLSIVSSVQSITADLEKMKCLIVNDEPMQLGVLEMIFQNEDFRV